MRWEKTPDDRNILVVEGWECDQVSQACMDRDWRSSRVLQLIDKGVRFTTFAVHLSDWVAGMRSKFRPTREWQIGVLAQEALLNAKSTDQTTMRLTQVDGTIVGVALREWVDSTYTAVDILNPTSSAETARELLKMSRVAMNPLLEVSAAEEVAG